MLMYEREGANMGKWLAKIDENQVKAFEDICVFVQRKKLFLLCKGR